jgi:1-deoxy-D-xylulose-5-phosphate synthase
LKPPKINLTTLTPDTVRAMDLASLQELAAEIRGFLIESVTKTGGHLASNLGSVELTIALTHVFNLNTDTIIYDVGHQVYPHKIMTRRAELFSRLRQFKGLSGFPRYTESMYDHFETGHSSTSLSAAAGVAYHKYLHQDTGRVIAVIGDGAFTGGLALEGLNNLVQIPYPVMIVLNDNDMSISENVGALAQVFKDNERSKQFFESLGYDYVSAYEGHDLTQLISVFSSLTNATRPTVVHVRTIKGYGYQPAEDDKVKYHGVGYYTIDPKPKGPSWSSYIAKLVEAYPKVQIITPAMIEGSGLRGVDSSRVLDVGIAEAHAVTMAAAMVRQGSSVFLPIYSTFLQRAYDSLIHDVCRPNIPVVFGIDRAGTIPQDGSTHQGIFDIAALSALPHIQIVMPKDGPEAKALVAYAFQQTTPIAIRYPKGNSIVEGPDVSITSPTWEVISDQPGPIVVTYGPDVYAISKALQAHQVSATLINARFIKPMDETMVAWIATSKRPVIVYEQVMYQGSLGQQLQAKLSNEVHPMSYHHIPEHGEIDQLLHQAGLSMDDVITAVKRYAH